MFLGFFILSLHDAIEGSDICGCFGTMRVPPIVTSVLDFTVLLCLGLGDLNFMGALARRNMFRFMPVGIAASAMLCMLGNRMMWSLDSTREQPFVFEAKDWVGRDFPLVNDISSEGPEAIQTGRWIVLIYHADCDECTRSLAEFESTLGGSPMDWNGVSCGMVEVPSYGKVRREAHAAPHHIVRFKLSASRNWYIPTPRFLQLRNGIIEKVSTRLNELAR